MNSRRLDRIEQALIEVKNTEAENPFAGWEPWEIFGMSERDYRAVFERCGPLESWNDCMAREMGMPLPEWWVWGIEGLPKELWRLPHIFWVPNTTAPNGGKWIRAHNF